MNHQIDIQVVVNKLDIPDQQKLRQWATCALQEADKPYELCIRIVDEAESATLNQRYRNKKGPTNVLSFPMQMPDDLALNYLGDIIICAPLVAHEANEQGKTLIAHWAHLVIHGVLHLLGYDHIKEQDAQVMEALEIELLASLGFANPYEEEDKVNE